MCPICNQFICSCRNAIYLSPLFVPVEECCKIPRRRIGATGATGSTGLIGATGATGNISSVFGEIYSIVGGLSSEVIVSGPPQILTTYSNTGSSSGTTPLPFSGSITVNTPGLYEINFNASFSFSGSPPPNGFTFQAFINNVSLGNIGQSINYDVNDVPSTSKPVSFSGFARILAGQVVTIRVASTNSVTLLVNSANLHLYLISS